VAPDGHVVAQAPQRRQVVLEQRVTLLHRLTPAVRMGAWPELVLSGLAALALVLSLLTPAVRRRSRRGPRRDPEPLDDPARASEPTASGARS
jgi:apolipoprotein N-acyltransferase